MVKRFISLILSIIIASACITTVSATVNGYNTYSVLDLKVGETMQYTSTDSYGNAYKGWTSTNPKVASITTDGFCTALSAGEAIMELTQPSGYKIGRKVIVTEPAYKLSKTSVSLYVGGKYSLKLKNAAGTIKWTTTNKAVAAVSAKGVVTAKKAGKATIKAIFKGKTFKCAVTVKTKPVTLSQSNVTLNAGKKFTLKLTNAKGKIKWSSSKSTVASVSSKGVVNAKKAGKAVISAKANGKNYKCTFTVVKKNAVAKTIAGTKTVNESANCATISNVKTSLDPAMLSKNAKLTLKTVSNLPKLGGAALKAYDFSLSGAKVTSNNLAVLEIPQTVKKGKVPVAGYYNEKQKKWEPVPCSYKNGKISIIASHFSTYGVGAVSDSFFTYNDNTTIEKILSYWVPSSPTITGEEAMKITSESLKKGSVASKCVEWGWDAFNKLFDNNVNRKANLYGALGISTKLTDFINDNTVAFGAVGFALAYVDAIKYALQGDKKMAAYTAFNGCSGGVTALLANEIGGMAMSAGCFAVAIISYALIETYKEALSDNENKWYTYYKYYYNNIKPRRAYQWKELLLPIIENKKNTPEQIKKEVEALVDKHVQEAWESSDFDLYFYEATGIKFSKGGLDKAIMNKLSAQYKHELMNGDIALVYKWYATSLQKDAEKSLETTVNKIAAEFNQEFTISFYDGQLKKGAKSKLEGYTVRWKNISKKLTDKKNLTLKLNSKGKASTKYTLFAALKYNIKPTVELVNKKGKVVKTFTYKINSKTTKININPVSDTAKTYKWVLSSTETCSLRSLIGLSTPKETLTSCYTKSYYDGAITHKYSFSFGSNSITTKYTYTYIDSDSSANNESGSSTHKAEYSAPKTSFSPGAKASVSTKISVLNRSANYGEDISSSVNITAVNPKDEINPKYPWVSSSTYYLNPVSIDAVNSTENSKSNSAELPVPQKRADGGKLVKGDVFYLVMSSSTSSYFISNYIVYKYEYKLV